MRRHAGNIVEDDLHESVAVVRSGVSRGGLAVQATHEAGVGGQVDFPAEPSHKASIFRRAHIISQNGVLVLLARLHEDQADFHHFSSRQLIQFLQRALEPSIVIQEMESVARFRRQKAQVRQEQPAVVNGALRCRRIGFQRKGISLTQAESFKVSGLKTLLVF